MSTLFNDINLDQYLRNRIHQAVYPIDNMQNEMFASLDLGVYASQQIAELQIQPIEIDVNEIEYSDEGQANIERIDYGRVIEVKGLAMAMHVPYQGSEMLWRCIPQRRQIGANLNAIVNSEKIVIYKAFSEDQSDKIKQEFERDLNSIKGYLDNIRSMLDQYNENVQGAIKNAIKDRETRISRHANLISSLGLPMKREKREVTEIQIPVQRRESPTKKVLKRKKNQGEVSKNYILEDKEYDYILNVLRQMTFVMERTPKVFRDFDEESIRDIFLVVLNGHYEGQATGETFNNEGKTDILIRQEGKNAFIAECKFWRGAESFIETIDQITERYITWRDTKAAILIFNRNKNFSSVVEQIPDLCRKHKHYLKDAVNGEEETEFRFITKHKDDDHRHIHITVMAFDIPS